MSKQIFVKQVDFCEKSITHSFTIFQNIVFAFKALSQLAIIGFPFAIFVHVLITVSTFEGDEGNKRFLGATRIAIYIRRNSLE